MLLRSPRGHESSRRCFLTGQDSVSTRHLPQTMATTHTSESSLRRWPQNPLLRLSVRLTVLGRSIARIWTNQQRVLCPLVNSR